MATDIYSELLKHQSPPISAVVTSHAEKVANAKPHTGIVHCFVGSWDAGTGTAPGFAYSSAVLPSTFPAAYPPWNSVRTRWCGYALTSDRATEKGERGREGGGVGDSRVFLVPIHNCKFPSPYLCSPVSYRAPTRLADSLIRVCLPQTPPPQTRKTKSENIMYFSAMALREFPSLS